MLQKLTLSNTCKLSELCRLYELYNLYESFYESFKITWNHLNFFKYNVFVFKIFLFFFLNM